MRNNCEPDNPFIKVTSSGHLARKVRLLKVIGDDSGADSTFTAKNTIAIVPPSLTASTKLLARLSPMRRHCWRAVLLINLAAGFWLKKGCKIACKSQNAVGESR